jgi:hypothetical protein
LHFTDIRERFLPVSIRLPLRVHGNGQWLDGLLRVKGRMLGGIHRRSLTQAKTIKRMAHAIEFVFGSGISGKKRSSIG